MSFICFDTEDDSKEIRGRGESGFNKTVTQIAAIAKSGKRFYWKLGQGDGKKKFLSWLAAQPEQNVYALNTQYDLGNLFSKELDELDLTMVGGRLIKAVWTNKRFYDVWNLYQMSVAKLGKVFGLEKLETEDMANDKAYVFRDVEIIFRAVDFANEFAQEFEIKNLPATIAGLCVKVWKAMGGVNCHDTNPLSREAYYGGRVELFKSHNDSPDICYTDINSLYPSQMLGEFPETLSEWTEDTLPLFGVARVTVEASKRAIGVLPFRHEDGRILYPYGKFTGAWTIAEIKAAMARGYKVLKVHECWGTNDSFRPYKEFMQTSYDRRLASKNESERAFFKLLMNNLYGRLGTGGVIGRTVYQTFENQDEGICFGKKVLVNYEMPLALETNWCHAAYVTAYGRLRLLNFIEKLGVEKLIYCDTDSMIFDWHNTNVQSLPFKCSTDLGEMKLEGWGDACQCYAPKMYSTRIGGETKYKAKGVPVKLAQKFIEAGRVDFDLPFKMRESIRFYDKGNKKELSVWRRVEKFNRVNYDKKIRRGNRFYPLQIKED